MDILECLLCFLWCNNFLYKVSALSICFIMMPWVLANTLALFYLIKGNWSVCVCVFLKVIRNVHLWLSVRACYASLCLVMVIAPHIHACYTKHPAIQTAWQWHAWAPDTHASATVGSHVHSTTQRCSAQLQACCGVHRSRSFSTVIVRAVDERTSANSVWVEMYHLNGWHFATKNHKAIAFSFCMQLHSVLHTWNTHFYVISTECFVPSWKISCLNSIPYGCIAEPGFSGHLRNLPDPYVLGV